MNILKFFKSLVTTAIRLAKASGLTDDVIKIALKYVKLANDKYVDNSASREYVVDVLMRRGLPESIARIAVELAYRLYKDQLAKVVK